MSIDIFTKFTHFIYFSKIPNVKEDIIENEDDSISEKSIKEEEKIQQNNENKEEKKSNIEVKNLQININKNDLKVEIQTLNRFSIFRYLKIEE